MEQQGSFYFQGTYDNQSLIYCRSDRSKEQMSLISTKSKVSSVIHNQKESKSKWSDTRKIALYENITVFWYFIIIQEVWTYSPLVAIATRILPCKTAFQPWGCQTPPHQGFRTKFISHISKIYLSKLTKSTHSSSIYFKHSRCS